MLQSKDLKRLIITLIIPIALVLIGRSLLTGVGLAQENEQVQTKSPAVVMNIGEIYIPCEDPTNALCIPYPTDVSEHPLPGQENHELGLWAESFFPPNSEVYIVGCVETNEGAHCTTGDPSLDDLLNRIPGGDTMSPFGSHVFKAMQNPIVADTNGEIGTVIVHSFTPLPRAHFFNAYYLIETGSGDEPEIAIEPTHEEALKLESFEISTPTPIPTPRPRPQRERNRRLELDPKGRTFDAKSLEPVLETEVALLDNFKNLFNYSSLVNPQTVKRNGEFNFWVPNGIYYLDLLKKPSTHLWPMELEKVDVNYKKAYYCDPEVRNKEDSPVALYYDQFSIIEYNKLVHCDVPLDPGSNQPFRSKVATIDFSVSRVPNSAEVEYSGRISHPLSIIQLTAESTNNVVVSASADKLGYWSAKITGAQYPVKSNGAPDRIEIVYLKTDLTGGSSAVESSLGPVFDPILRYIEGYAYDQAGQIIPHAKVGLKQKNTDQIIYITTADKNGFFRIGSQYLPSFPYDLIFAYPDKPEEIQVSTSSFVDLNNDYLQKNGLNLVTDERTNIPLDKKTIASLQGGGGPLGQIPDSAAAPTENERHSGTGQSAFLIIIIFILVSAAGLVILFQLIKSKQSKIPSGR